MDLLLRHGRATRTRRAVHYSCSVSRDGGRSFAGAGPRGERGIRRVAAGGAPVRLLPGSAGAAGVAHPIWTDTRQLAELQEEIYTTRVTAADLAARWLDGRRLPGRPQPLERGDEPGCRSAHSIVIDVQNEYFDGALPISDPPPELSLANIGRAMDAATAAGVPVIVVRHGDADPEAPIFREGSHAWELHPEVERRSRDHLVEKTLPGSFTGTPLEGILDGGRHRHGCDHRAT